MGTASLKKVICKFEDKIQDFSYLALIGNIVL